MRLFSPFALGGLVLPNRIVMAALSRHRAADKVPGDLNALYYAQRAEAGLIVAEAADVDPEAADEAPDRPGIFNAAQARGWRGVTDRVHRAGGRIVLQLCHYGRPEGLPAREIARLVRCFGAASALARAAGFDGIEVQAGRDRLIGRFLDPAQNRRTDRYGGSAEGRARFLLEVVEAVAPAWGDARIGVRFSAGEVLDHLAAVLPPGCIGYLHLALGEDAPPASLRGRFGGAVVLAGRFTRATAEAALVSGAADLIAFGLPFVANPDLPFRLRHDLALAMADRETLRGGGARGYADYPRFEGRLREISFKTSDLRRPATAGAGNIQ